MKKPFLTLLLLSCTTGFGGAHAAVYDATDAISEAPYHTPGTPHHHALWMKYLGTAPSKSWIFEPSPGSFLINGMGNAEFTGSVKNKADSTLTGNFNFLFTPAASGDPKLELNDGSYVGDAAAGPRDIDPSTWSYWNTQSANFLGTGQLSGLELMFTQRPIPGTAPEDWKGQLGVGANGKNGRLGFSSWFYWKVIGCTDATTGNDGCAPLKLSLHDKDVGDININLSPVPVPAAVWLFGTAILGLLGWRRRSAANV